MELPRTIYHLKLQDAGRELQPLADIVSASPFPRFEDGEMVTVKHTVPNVWAVIGAPSTVIEYSRDQAELHVSTCLIVDSPCHRADGLPRNPPERQG